MHQVQLASGGGDHADRVAGVRRDPGREEHQPKHSTMIAGAGHHTVAHQSGHELGLNCGKARRRLSYSSNCHAYQA
jgi:hypothetical protein